MQQQPQHCQVSPDNFATLHWSTANVFFQILAYSLNPFFTVRVFSSESLFIRSHRFNYRFRWRHAHFQAHREPSFAWRHWPLRRITENLQSRVLREAMSHDAGLCCVPRAALWRHRRLPLWCDRKRSDRTRHRRPGLQHLGHQYPVESSRYIWDLRAIMLV